MLCEILDRYLLQHQKKLVVRELSKHRRAAHKVIRSHKDALCEDAHRPACPSPFGIHVLLQHDFAFIQILSAVEPAYLGTHARRECHHEGFSAVWALKARHLGARLLVALFHR